MEKRVDSDMKKASVLIPRAALCRASVDKAPTSFILSKDWGFFVRGREKSKVFRFGGKNIRAALCITRGAREFFGSVLIAPAWK